MMIIESHANEHHTAQTGLQHYAIKLDIMISWPGLGGYGIWRYILSFCKGDAMIAWNYKALQLSETQGAPKHEDISLDETLSYWEDSITTGIDSEDISLTLIVQY